MVVIITVIISFLFGSIPTGYLVTKNMYGIDIRTKGSGNIGSTNVKRIVGRKPSLITQVMDIAKGMIPVIIGIYISNTMSLPIPKAAYLSSIAVAAILGHDYTPFLAFRGGKGVNTTLGAFVFVTPIATLSGVAVYFILRLFTGIVSIRSISLGVTIPIVCAIMKLPLSITIATTIAAILIIIRHKDNLIRLIKKEEK
ncbi:glycerol-3-phosphate 1-O-acyltransferase PlsY [Clostridium thailandense]|uniref:Glycerol-3-phosphate acyltransferase n=1 Tax=Clostridium thailandense TaxID=2794346 RepID=A0A949TXW9_9CLOT|nr:glycerol-3-phosphate 1-O-acyltransferase PlsY [Clostridium thailandense]MBV7272519.1 glycerol-3-phosphate acyltransferase [Clostridium thailandense]MCH5138079.1 glycerol-3-phosphate acyltransferase [Clostridiaceae bacterium UIB06]